MVITSYAVIHFILLQFLVILFLVGWVIIIHKKQKRANELALSDPLTKLFNRAGFNKVIYQAQIKIQKQQISTLTLFLIDIDNFKKINDTKGHLVGDECLRELANRLTVDDHFVGSPGFNYFVSRLGGDEFVVVIEDISDTAIDTVASQLIEKIRQPIIIDDDTIYLTVSIGISVYGPTINSTSLLLKAADVALYKVKDFNKNNYAIHTTEMDVDIQDMLDYELIIDDFIKNKNFNIEYQPIIDITSYDIVGAEALFRGNVELYPDLNIPKLFKVAESTGIITKFGAVINEHIFRDIPLMLHAVPDFLVSINVSVAQLENCDNVDWLVNDIKKHNIPPENVDVELTESVVIHDFDRSIITTRQLKDNKLHISLDDFGSGYSSMLYLQELPADKIKIDKGFIQDLSTNHKSQKIVKAIILMAKMLNIKTCAEGVENDEQLNILKQFGCDQIQGFICAKSLPLNDLLQELTFIKNNSNII